MQGILQASLKVSLVFRISFLLPSFTDSLPVLLGREDISSGVSRGPERYTPVELFCWPLDTMYSLVLVSDQIQYASLYTECRVCHMPWWRVCSVHVYMHEGDRGGRELVFVQYSLFSYPSLIWIKFLETYQSHDHACSHHFPGPRFSINSN